MPGGLVAHVLMHGEHVSVENDNDGHVDEYALELKQWLIDNVKLVQYYDNFILNGCESLLFVKEISDESELIEIGVDIKEHQMIILSEIDKLSITKK